ncbi:L-rhamnose mutarotase (plasmid) [Haloterrigena salifodinae]|uniref:L-rhamnose mutarotase n=1 Tax=Haloterrigena salifodinae TaxID=2675099 RepID=A0A8T8E909_9EURY|nr:L-rhamnose mutarotase [Haloterrigena salifodinae]QRV17891.1 L-rhamnose mutarotase [Haloterrigena salifodinae]
MTNELERAVYVQRIDPDRTAEYIEAHDDVPDGVTEAMERASVETFQLFVRDDIVVCFLECPDVDAYDEVMANDPDVEAWERRVARFKRNGVDADAAAGEQIPYMEEIWSFES